MLERKGAVVWDADRAAHELMAPGSEAHRAVARRFGPGILREDGAIDRPALGRRVFGNAEELKALNALVHPAVLAQMRAWRAEEQAKGRPALAVVPLLYEAGAEQGWDAVICVGAPKEAVLKRLLERGLSAEDAERRLSAQMPVEMKMERADYAVWNGGSLEELEQKLTTIWLDILQKQGTRR